MLQHKTSKFVVKYSNDDERTIEGYASVFKNLDSDMDTIQPGAFKRTIKAIGPEGQDRIKLCAQHDMKRPIAKMLELKEDEHGLYMKAKFGTHRDGEDYYRMAKEGIIDEFSVGFVAKEKEENEKGGYDISQIKLYEVSMVTVAANDEAVVTDVKSASLAEVGNLVKQIEDEELAHKLETKLLGLAALINETSTQPKSDLEVKEDITESEVEKTDETLETLIKLKQLL